MLAPIHTRNDGNGHQEPGRVVEIDHPEIRRFKGTKGFLSQNNNHYCEKAGAIDDAWQTDPFLATNVGIQTKNVKGAKAQRIEPDRGIPPHGTRHLQRVEATTIGMHHVDKKRWRPERIHEVVGVGNHQLLKINNIGDEAEVENEKGNDEPVKASLDDQHWLQKFTPRRPKSIWSKVNCNAATALLAAGKMQPPGILQIELAKADGRWEAAYESQSQITIPADLQSELDKNQQAQEFFRTLDSRNRYAVLFRIQTAKKPETRAARIQKFVEMLSKNQKIYP